MTYFNGLNLIFSKIGIVYLVGKAKIIFEAASYFTIIMIIIIAFTASVY
jgi:hypothetical protein